MTSSTDDSTDDAPADASRRWPDIGRRPLLKALGIGAALPHASGVAAAGDDAVAARDSVNTDADQIHPVFGYPVTDVADIPESLAPDHEVELHRVFPENPDNPKHPSIFHFEPSGLHVDTDDIVQFTYESPNHTVSPYHPGHGFQRRVPEGVPPFSSPLVKKDGAWLYRFTQKGLYDLFCGVHEIAGMTMRLVVGDLAEEDVPDYEDTFEAEPPLFPPVPAELLEHELEATSDENEDIEWTWLTAPEVLDADALDPATIQDASTVPFKNVADELGVPFDPDH
ncbi:plastocyanin [Halorussus sp. MSC15.2]|uniref:cupredoxin domain-containing protein n=1 Tax=Halorussus sp. MSC15.2 TaxID=2283638 RepID=UPI0013D6DB44|nr:plastocyanin [Halorussus sp. MSC15.2]NEU58775.1 plastocyanin [Halorussus sp. MSC15.2]